MNATEGPNFKSTEFLLVLAYMLIVAASQYLKLTETQLTVIGAVVAT